MESMVEVGVCVTLLLVCITVLVWIHVCMVERSIRRSEDGEEEEDEEGGRKGCEEEVKNKVGYFEYKLMMNKDSCVCVVCLDNFKVGDACRSLPKCGHSFHVHCIDLWLLKTPKCPICRTWVLSLDLEISDV